MLLPVFLIGGWNGWNPLEFLVYSPAKAITQELFFRCTVFLLFLLLLKGHPYPAIFLAALAHGLWHVGLLAMGHPWSIVISVMAVPFLCGYAEYMKAPAGLMFFSPQGLS